jgi:hypothetical protein
MSNSSWIVVLLFSLVSCGEAVKKKSTTNPEKGGVAKISKNVKYIDSATQSTGLKIKWAYKGKGETIEIGDVILINYVVTLPNGKLVDGSSKITKSDLPFIVGYNLQTKGWDDALLAMKVGDVATIVIPAELGRSDRSLGEVLPANADNLLQIHVVKKIKPSIIENGSKIWRWSLKKNEKSDLSFGPGKTIKFHLLANSNKEVGVINTFAKNMLISNKFEDEIYPSSLKKALTNAKKGQGVFMLLSPSDVSQIKGLERKIDPSQPLFYSIQIVDVISK